MKSATKLALVVGGCGLVLVVGSLNAFATYTSTTSSATLKVAAAELPRGDVPTVDAHGANVLVRWEPSVLGDGNPAASYIVTRAGASKSMVVCNRVTATNCTDEKVPDGTWTWRVRPVVGDWEGTDSPDSKPLVVLSPKASPTVGVASPPPASEKSVATVATVAAEAPAPEPPKAVVEQPAEVPTSPAPTATPEETKVDEPAPPAASPAAEDSK
jgi:hypothetical protein